MAAAPISGCGSIILFLAATVAVLAVEDIATTQAAAGCDPNSPECKGADSNTEKEFALFTHTNRELHCKERELRHPCVEELRKYIEDKNHTESRSIALQCVRDVLAVSDDYWELKNMTHLLLDLDTIDHVFDTTSYTDDFVMTGVDYAAKLMDHPQCRGEFDTKGEMECRCVPLYGKVSILKLKNAGKTDEAQELFRKLKATTWNGGVRTYGPGEAVRWDDYRHTPQIWVQNLRSQPIWGRETWKDLPICSKLEENYETIRQETQQALMDEDENFEDAYRFLYKGGDWNQVILYTKREFTEECDTLFPKTCALLRQWLPSKPGLPWTSDQNEQVIVLKMKVGTDVETHSGPANNILNIHLGISGTKGARLVVAGETYAWEEGKVIAWDGSFDHKVDCLECEQERVVMLVRYMHPDMTPAHYKGWTKTHFESIPEEYQ